MAKARLLPSGAYQTRITKVIGGKKITKSFTVHPKEMQGSSKRAKLQSELLARQWKLSAEDEEIYGPTVGTAMENFIEKRRKVLSPSTITNYELFVPYFKSIAHISINDIKTADIQPLVSEWGLNLTAKTIKNRISFLLTVLDDAECDRKFKIVFPKNPSRKVKAPELEDVQRLIRYAPEDLLPIIYLAAVGSMRRGELAGLKQSDISREMRLIYVHTDVVKSGKEWVLKNFTKNGIARTVELPQFIIDLIPKSDNPNDFVFGLNPSQISNRYDRYRRKLGLSCSLHSLRHFAASFRSDLNIPRKYIEEVGGWEKGSKALTKIYDDNSDAGRKKYTQIANSFVEENLKLEGLA